MRADLTATAVALILVVVLTVVSAWALEEWGNDAAQWVNDLA